jgi:hypothetical protein
MNGRIYDPAIGRFLSADPHVPDPADIQSHNRYSYVRNRPMSVADPSGFWDEATGTSSFPVGSGMYGIDMPFRMWSGGMAASQGTLPQGAGFALGYDSVLPYNNSGMGFQATADARPEVKGARSPTRDTSAAEQSRVDQAIQRYQGCGSDKKCVATELAEMRRLLTDLRTVGVSSYNISGLYANIAQADVVLNGLGGTDSASTAMAIAGISALGGQAKGTGIVAKDGTAITGLTKHGVDRAIGDGTKRAGTKPDAILDAIKNPTKIKEGVDNFGRPFKVYTGENARVVINPETGKIISTNPLSRDGAHLP